MARAMSSALRVAVPLNTRCSIRWEIPPRSSGSQREPVPTQMPTATDRTCGIRSVRMRMPLGRTPRRYSSITGDRRASLLELLAIGQGRLLAQRDLPRQAHLAVAVDLDDLDQHLVPLREDVAHRANAVLRDLGDVQEALGVGDDLDERP